MRDGPTGLLTGIRVLELGNFVAAPFACRLFADFGADVIKIERPGAGDEVRHWRMTRGSTSMMFRTLARNKRSVTIDLNSPSGRDLVLELVAQADVVVENFRPGTLERWGLGPEALQERNPDVVLVRISGYGQTGPRKDEAGFGSAAEAFGGLRYITGSPDGEPVRPAASMADTVAGLYGVIGALMLLLRKARGPSLGDSPHVVDVALYEAVFSLLESLVPDYDAYGIVRERSGGRLPGVVPTGDYPCLDGKSVIIGGNANGVFRRLMQAIGRDDLAVDPRLQDGDGRARHEEEIEDAITTWTSSQDVNSALKVLADARVPSAPVYDAAQIARDEHYLARGMVRRATVSIDDEPEEIRFPGVVPVLPGQEGQLRWVGPELGAHTDEVLHEVLGADQARIQSLREAGVI